MSDAVERLNLSPAAAAGAETLLALFPDIVFNSGRRGVADQARAMAQNVVRNRRWIEQTYVGTAESRALQAWIDGHPAADDQAEIAAGLASIMDGWTDAQRAKLSKHFSGDAFDVQPVIGPRGEEMKAEIRELPGLVKFLEREGGLVRWHAQFA
jgi:hypothetical protein